jgi:circadian clock protein KaiC
MVDSWIELNSELKEYRAFRHLMVHKYRGSDFLAGRHVFTISNQGITVLPRLELVARRQPAPGGPGRLSTGCAELDGMLEGGLPHSSTTLIHGPTGVGKSIFGLHFISRSSAGEPGLVFGFYETPDRLALKAAALGMPLDDLVRSGALQILWHPPAESLLDQLACRLLECVHARGVKRLLIDGLDAFAATPIYPQRMGPFLSALTNELRDAGVTTMMTAETDQGNAGLGAPDLTLPLSSMSAVAENILLLRYREREARLQRTLTVVKVRESQFDHRVREFSIGSTGICFADRATDAGTSDQQA